MKILICTPCAGGQASTNYFLPLITDAMMALEKLKLNEKARIKGKELPYEIGFYTLSAESLISRGRNHCAQVALSGGWDRLFFIDADVGWTWPQFKTVVDNCDASKGLGISTGACPLKRYPIQLNYWPLDEDLFFYEKTEGPDGKKIPMRTPQGMIHHSHTLESALVEVKYMGTAFMCIDVQVFEDLKPFAVPYMYPNPHTGVEVEHWDFFPMGPKDGKFIGEDWGFCHLARENGHKVWLNANVCVTHTGVHTFQVDLNHAEEQYIAKRDACIKAAE